MQSPKAQLVDDLAEKTEVQPAVGPYFVPVVLLSLAAFGAACGAVIGRAVGEEVRQRAAGALASSASASVDEAAVK